MSENSAGQIRIPLKVLASTLIILGILEELLPLVVIMVPFALRMPWPNRSGPSWHRKNPQVQSATSRL